MSSLSTTTSSSITSSSIISSSSANYSSTPLMGSSLSHRRERNLSIDTTRVVDDVFTSTINGANSSASPLAHSCPLPSPQSLPKLPSLGDQHLIQMLRSIQYSPTSSGLSTYGNSASIALTPGSSLQESYQPSPTANSDSKDSSSTISEEEIIVIV